MQEALYSSECIDEDGVIDSEGYTCNEKYGLLKDFQRCGKYDRYYTDKFLSS